MLFKNCDSFLFQVGITASLVDRFTLTHHFVIFNVFFQSRIRQKVERRGISAIIHSLFGPPKLQRNLHRERELVFCAAASEFFAPNSLAEVHSKLLKCVCQFFSQISKFLLQNYL